MLRVPVHKIEPGMVLARPIPLPNDPYRYLLQRDIEIPMDLVPRLEQLGILDVWVRYRDLEFLEDLIDEGLSEHQREVYVQVRRNFEAIMGDSTAAIDLVHFEDAIAGLFDFLKGFAGSNILLQKLDAFDDYLMSHSTNVCYLAMLLGMKLDRYLIDQRRHKTAREAKDLNMLALGCLLHDIGKMRVRPDVLHKPGKLTDRELAEMQRHPSYGYALVKDSIPPPAAQIVLNHHRRYDGHGYPPRIDHHSGGPLPPLQGQQIPVFSRIAMMVDVYDAATSRRCYSAAKPPVQVLHEMQTRCRGFFDPVVESAFYQIVPAFPIGQIVTLTDGTEAAVVDFNPDFPTRPKVQCLRTATGHQFSNPALEEVDLALHLDLGITEVDGIDVRPFMALQEPAELEPTLV